MKMTNEQLANLLGSVANTAADELSCEACESHFAQFAELQVGQPETQHEIPAALQAIAEHLRICPECTEELEFLKRALEAERDG